MGFAADGAKELAIRGIDRRSEHEDVRSMRKT
jgi:hypothetical protein